MATLINLLGGPGVGKSLTVYGLMYLMKLRGLKVEYIPEFAKSIVWRKEFHLLNDQKYLINETYKLIKDINDSVDYIVLDGPITLGLYYNRYYNPETYDKSLDDYILEKHNEFNNINIMLERNRNISYEEAGRFQNKEQAEQVDVDMLKIFNDNQLPIHQIEVKICNDNLENGHVIDVLKLLGIELNV